jgi:hypothetical protein
MKFFFPDAQDMIYPGYDFINDEYPAHRVRQRDDRYAHEVLKPTPYDGMLLSKAIVDGVGKATGKYSQAQRDRLYRRGARKFFRLPDSLSLLGDNGAFSYVDEDAPPVTVDEVLDFYELCGCDAGISVDHLILAFDADPTLFAADPDWIRRRDLTLELASQFLHEIRRRKSRVEPIGAAQGWSPQSYADSVRQLQGMGYGHVALGGMVPLKTRDILSTLRTVSEVLKPDTKLHLLGIARPEAMKEFVELGVTSFDSTSPFRQAFMDDRKNYHTPHSHYVAIRVPQIDGNARLKRRILAGDIDQANAIHLEKACLKGLRAFDRGDATVSSVLTDLRDYEALVEPSKPTYLQEYERMLDDRPWRQCGCQMCTRWGIDVAIFRGTERNKRRGFHNIAVLAQQVPGRPQIPTEHT